ncbi:MAG: TatD family hydrolase [Thermodesulfobacteriota bacterium]
MLDCHSHLLDITNFSSDFFLASLEECHIRKIYCNIVDVKQWSSLSSLTEKYPQIIPFFGIHPWHITHFSFNDLEPLADLLRKELSCCGEIGLDRRCDTDFLLQKKMFVKQLDLAKDTQSFVAIHCVKAWGPLLEILAGYQGKISFMIHSFQGSREVMERLVAMGGMISFSDRVMQSKQKKLQEVLKVTPLENLLLETDFPFQTSIEGSSSKIYCQVLSNLYTFVARLREISASDLSQIIERNGSICTY